MAANRERLRIKKKERQLKEDLRHDFKKQAIEISKIEELREAIIIRLKDEK